MSDPRPGGWIGVDLDGTLAQYDGWQGIEHVGEPVPAMLERVKVWLAQGVDIRIFTARVAHCEPGVVRVIEDWCERHIGQRLRVTCQKDFGMVELWDDRCVQVVPNTGRRADTPESTDALLTPPSVPSLDVEACELRPCPFCGGEPYRSRSVNGTQEFKVGCASCGFQFKTAWYRDEANPTRDIVAAWNQRALASALPGMGARIGDLEVALDAAIGRRRIEVDAWRGFAYHVAHCVECGEMMYTNCFEGNALHEAAVSLGAMPEIAAARAAQPEETSADAECEEGCRRCSGEYCERHGTDPCDCDVIDRHTPTETSADAK